MIDAITSNEVARVFAIFEGCYGFLWKQDPSAIDVWFRQLAGKSERALFQAVEIALKQYKDRPPTLGQFASLCNSMSIPNYKKLPAPDKASWGRRQANKILTRIIVARGGVPDATLKMLLQLRDALVEDLGTADPSDEWVTDIRGQFNKLIQSNAES